MPGLRIAFFGTPEIAVPTLERLLASRHRLAIAVSQPDRGRGRGRKTSPSPVSAAAEAAGVPLLRPERVGAVDCVDAPVKSGADLGVVVAFGQFLPKAVREFPRLGYLINAHASLLPRHRGAAPIAHAILAGDRETGVSVMRIEREMDTGSVTHVCSTSIGKDENAGELTERLGRLAADAILAALDGIAGGQARWCEQDAAKVTLAPKIGRDDARLDWREPALALVRRVRAMAPAPGAFTEVAGEPLRILAARADVRSAAGEAPGTVRVDANSGLRIATGNGWLVPASLQRAGARAMPTEAYLRGRDIADGTRLT